MTLDDLEYIVWLSLQRECLTQSSNTRAFWRVLFITTITLAVNNDDGST